MSAIRSSNSCFVSAKEEYILGIKIEKNIEKQLGFWAKYYGIELTIKSKIPRKVYVESVSKSTEYFSVGQVNSNKIYFGAFMNVTASLRVTRL